MLLISTLTSVKHTGAAFAAHNSLQEIASACLSQRLEPEAAQLPQLWINRLLDEISITNKVRDSTLRRSTGYALGFLAIMRSEISSSSGPSTLCQQVLTNILRLSLPSKQRLRLAFEKLGLTRDHESPVFAYLLKVPSMSYVPDESYEVSFEGVVCDLGFDIG
jgi:hypothetical protein